MRCEPARRWRIKAIIQIGYILFKNTYSNWLTISLEFITMDGSGQDWTGEIKISILFGEKAVWWIFLSQLIECDMCEKIEILSSGITNIFNY